jgi:hypothetical protein
LEKRSEQPHIGLVPAEAELGSYQPPVGLVPAEGELSSYKRNALPPVAVSLGPAGIKPNGVELKAERRKPSGEKHRDIEDSPSLTGVLAHFRLH